MIKRPGPEDPRHLLVAAQLLLFIGRGVAFEEQEFRAQQPAAFGALRHGERRIRLGAGEVGEHLDALAAREMAIRSARRQSAARAARGRVRDARRCREPSCIRVRRATCPHRHRG